MRIRLPRVVFFAITAILSVNGCDSNSTDDLIILTHTFISDTNGAPIRFSFSTNEIQTGKISAVSCSCSLDIGPFLSSRSFSKSELVNARITSVRLKSFFPVGERLDYLNEVRFILDTSETGAKTVARDMQLPAAQETALSVLAAETVTNLLTQPKLSAILELDPTALTPDLTYELGVEFTVQLEMESL